MKAKAPIDTAEILLGIGAVWLAIRGEDPQRIAARALQAADGLRTMLTRIEQVTEAQARRAMGCKGSSACDCLWCAEQRKDRAS